MELLEQSKEELGSRWAAWDKANLETQPHNSM